MIAVDAPSAAPLSPPDAPAEPVPTGAGRVGGVVVAVTPARRGYHRTKRAIDVTGAAACLLVGAPVFAGIAIAVRLTSPGPAVFTQERVGVRRRMRGNEVAWELSSFRIRKFRSMPHDTDPALHEAHVRSFVTGELVPADGRAGFKLAHSPRVTRVGALLRRWSLDELPQFYNVLRGDMSLVGPRPVPAYEIAHYRPAELERLAAVPGLTGLWQISGRCAISFEEMVRLDVDYARRASLRLDASILLRTIPAVLSGRGAA